MKKILLIASFILLFASFSILGYIVVEAKQEIINEKDIIKEQTTKEAYLTPYGYTIENPNIILDPYNTSPLTALILFETNNEEEITITIKGKDEKSTITNTFKPTTTHYIPIYGLYPNKENEVILQTSTKTITHTIKTSSLPSDLIKETIVNDTNNLIFLNTNNYIYALDNNNDIRWYLKEKYKYNIIKLNNGNFLIPTTTLNTNNYPTGLTEIDLLGKIYKQYNIENGYHGSLLEIDNSYYILSKNLLQIDKQTGYLIDKQELKEKYINMDYNKGNNLLYLSNETTTLTIDLTKKEQITNATYNSLSEKETTSLPYTTSDNYKITSSVIFDITNKTKESKEKIFLINYKKIDDTYKSYNINISKTKDYLKISGDFNNDKVYLILDKFMDKRVYDIKNNYTTINKLTLKGKYNIYLKINNTIYKTNQYVEF